MYVCLKNILHLKQLSLQQKLLEKLDISATIFNREVKNVLDKLIDMFVKPKTFER